MKDLRSQLNYGVRGCAGEERFKPNVNEDRVGELELLQQYLEGAVAKIDSAVQQGAAPKERMMRLLTSKDKRATLLEMAGGLSHASGMVIFDARTRIRACPHERIQQFTGVSSISCVVTESMPDALVRWLPIRVLISATCGRITPSWLAWSQHELVWAMV